MWVSRSQENLPLFRSHPDNFRELFFNLMLQEKHTKIWGGLFSLFFVNFGSKCHFRFVQHVVQKVSQNSGLHVQNGQNPEFCFFESKVKKFFLALL